MSKEVEPAGGASLGMKLWDRTVESGVGRTAIKLAAVLAVMSPFNARANMFEDMGGDLIAIFCDFLNSPVVTLVLAVALVVLLLMGASGEDNGLMTKIIRLLILGVGILFIPSLLSLMGFPIVCA